MDLIDTMKISAAGMRAQSERLKVVAQNIANAESVGTRPGAEPYRRKTITFKEEMDRETGLVTVRPSEINTDRGALNRQYEPANPLADAQGYVLYPNVNPMVEMMDMREARRSYEANLGVIEASKAMVGQTLSLLR